VTRPDVFEAISRERDYQDDKWGSDFDNKNTPNDWVSYIAIYLGKAVTFPWDRKTFRTAILKVATLCVAILEREEYAPRHYDTKGASA
jgi:hypothetical protein